MLSSAAGDSNLARFELEDVFFFAFVFAFFDFDFDLDFDFER
jgi:hypothetical protein